MAAPDSVGDAVKRRKVKCGKTGKTRYRDHIAAKLGLANIQTYGDTRGKTPQRVYYCHDCGGWHLTSRPSSGSR